MSNLTVEHVTTVHHWTDTLFSFTLTRDRTFRFRSGQFTMIGLQVDGRPLMRAYSLVSASYDDRLEFLSIKVPDGPLTSRLQRLSLGCEVLVSKKATGTLIADHLLPGRNLYLLATGTGLAPFLSLIRDPETYDRFERVILVHGCRRVTELAYEDWISTMLPNDLFIGEIVRRKLSYYPTVTRETFRNRGRITDLISGGKLVSDLSLPPLNKVYDRLMICGSPALLLDMDKYVAFFGFQEGNQTAPGQYVIEKAFVEK